MQYKQVSKGEYGGYTPSSAHTHPHRNRNNKGGGSAFSFSISIRFQITDTNSEPYQNNHSSHLTLTP
jgi:hypothetical protein